MRIGIDFDGTICDHHEHKLALAARHGLTLEPWQTNSNIMSAHVPQDIYRRLSLTLYGEMTLDAPPVPGALEAIASLPGELYVISARRPDSAPFALQWMEAHGVFDKIPRERVFFCAKDGDKHAHCLTQKIDLFIDDKVSVLDALPGGIKKIWFDEDGLEGRIPAPEGLKIAKNWQEAVAIFAEHVQA